MAQAKFASHEEAKKAGWHSRRNQTREAQDNARYEYFSKSSRTRAIAKRKGSA